MVDVLAKYRTTVETAFWQNLPMPVEDNKTRRFQPPFYFLRPRTIPTSFV